MDLAQIQEQLLNQSIQLSNLNEEIKKNAQMQQQIDNQALLIQDLSKTIQNLQNKQKVRNLQDGDELQNEQENVENEQENVDNDTDNAESIDQTYVTEKLTALTISASEALNAKAADSGWVMTAGVIIFFMQSGFALLESGSVRFKNYQNILLKNCLDACVGGIVWWAFGFAFAFGLQGDNKFIGTTYWFGTNLENEDAPGYGFWFFQFTFACTAATIVSGSLAERVNIHSYILFSALMTGFIYPLVVAWTWGGGFIAEWGFQDFAGSGVIHLTGGISGLAGAYICGPRLGKFKSEVNKDAGASSQQSILDGYAMVYRKYQNKEWDILRVHEFVQTYVSKLDNREINAHSPQQAVLGTLILWLGWLFFNGGSSAAISGGSNIDAERAIMNTVLAPASGGLLTFLIRKHITGDKKDIRMDFQALTNGILAGLVAVTASCNAIQPWAAVFIGMIGSVTYCTACRFMNKMQIDDPLEAFQVHGCCGFIGCIVLAIFRLETGIIYGGKTTIETIMELNKETGEMVEVEKKTIGGGELLGIQIVGCFIIILWSGGMSAAFFLLQNNAGSLRLSEQDEILGGDIHYFGPMEFHGVPADYDLVETMQKQIVISSQKLKEDEINEMGEMDFYKEENSTHRLSPDKQVGDLNLNSNNIIQHKANRR